MNKIQYHFDVSQITCLKYVPQTKKEWICWVDSKPIYKFFGLIKTNKMTKEGFEDFSTYGRKIKPKEELISDGNIVIGKEVFSKPKVVIYFRNKAELVNVFNEQEDALEWIEQLKITSGKTFEVI